MLIKTMKRNMLRNTVSQGGFTLIEVLVALLVLSIGLLGLAALQTVSLKFNADSYTRTQATILAYDIVDRMRANPAGVTAGDYDVADDSTAAGIKTTYDGCSKGGSCSCNSAVNCDAATLATYDLGQWYTRMEQLLPESTTGTNWAKVEPDANNKVTITIRWTERGEGKTQTWIVQL